MGGSSYSDDDYHARVAYKVSHAIPTFDYDSKIKSGAAPCVAHSTLDPKGVTRESRDSDAHPESLAIAIIFDGTGSMGSVPVTLQAKLPQLMGLLLRKGYVEHPQILFGAVQDYFADRVALQIGQFESGLEMDDNLTNLVLEGGGGGSYEESYQEALYFFGRHTSIDCFEKRGKKGYLFLIGDEKPYPITNKDEIKEIFGDDVQGPLTAETLVAEAQEKYHVFFLIPMSGTQHGRDPVLRNRWAALLGEDHVIGMQEADGVCEAIAVAIGVNEGTIDLDTAAAHLKEFGTSDAIVAGVSAALDPLAKSTALAKVGTGDLPGTSKRSEAVTRL